ncbi:hypothetical protein AK88_05615 [Plasmodium fragile]|uniref:Uncharacterized protein n=1 Tax=Plasmodium fragile TaxID=5857 RepID=A0A0D9QCI5_PLAFR|nr:uncharacterized protein AK88_05615 [Plasmodium fragile]KJP84755.1 hypothetical protein AK88_05615 [Plasmodium fragile]
MARHLVHVLADWAIKRGLWKQEQLDKALWEDMQNVLAQFVDYMEEIEDNLEDYATSCGDAGWERRGDRHKGTFYTGHTVADKMKCRLMVGALHFVAGWGSQLKNDNEPSENDNDMKAIMRCMVANVFAYILAEIKCRDEWPAIDQAWKIMKQIAVGTGDTSNPLFTGKCKLDEYRGTKVGTADLQGAVKKWLETNTTINDRINAIKKDPQCKLKWETYKKDMEQSGNDALGRTSGKVHPGVGAMANGGIGKEIVEVVKEVFVKMKDEVIEKSKSPPEIQGAAPLR